MTELFGVSRPTLRDALRDLRARHVLEAERGRNGGYRVGDLSLVLALSTGWRVHIAVPGATS